MCVNKIDVNFDSLEKTGDNILQYASDLKSEIITIKLLIDKLKDAWQGTDNMYFSNMLENSILPSFDKLDNIITNYGSFLLEANNEYKDVDNDTVGEFDEY